MPGPPTETAGSVVAADLRRGRRGHVRQRPHRLSTAEACRCRRRPFPPLVPHSGTVRGGGVAVGCGITVATALVIVWNIMQHGVFGLGSIMVPIGFLVLTWCYSAIGMSDDLDSLQPTGRLVGQVVLALVFSSCIALFSTQGIAHVLAFAIIGVTLVNAVNFVDGLNGYVTTWSIVTGAWFAFVGMWIGENDIMLLSLALAGAAAGFLPFNLGRARDFLGDTGSYGIGAAVFAIAVWLFVSGVPIVVIIAPMIFVLFDVGLTLVLRLFQGENIFLPHRQHIYQRIQQAGWSHGAVSLFHASLSVLACILAVPTLIAGNTSATYPAARVLGRTPGPVCAGAAVAAPTKHRRGGPRMRVLLLSPITIIRRSVPRSDGGGSSSTTSAPPVIRSSPSRPAPALPLSRSGRVLRVPGWSRSTPSRSAPRRHVDTGIDGERILRVPYLHSGSSMARQMLDQAVSATGAISAVVDRLARQDEARCLVSNPGTTRFCSPETPCPGYCTCRTLPRFATLAGSFISDMNPGHPVPSGSTCREHLPALSSTGSCRIS